MDGLPDHEISLLSRDGFGWWADITQDPHGLLGTNCQRLHQQRHSLGCCQGNQLQYHYRKKPSLNYTFLSILGSTENPQRQLHLRKGAREVRDGKLLAVPPS